MLVGLSYAFTTLSLVSGSALRGGGGKDQLSFSSEPSSASISPSSHPLNVNTSANYIFNSLAGALAQLPNTIHPNGHLLLPVSIPAFTTVYHARNDNGSVPSPDWVAMDAEMSYGIMTGRSGGTWLSTFVSAREIKLVYFDGNSAALGTPGWLDTQDVLAPPEEEEPPGRPGGGWNGEHERAVRLCEWNEREKLGLDGFLRMNSGFEVMWCDFDSGALELVSRINITPPDAPPSTGGGPWDRGGREGGGNHHLASTSSSRDFAEVDAVYPPPEGFYPGPGGPEGGGGGPPGRGRGSIYSSSSRFEWLRVSTHRYHLPQPHIIADWSSFVTFYHPRLPSLVEARNGVPRMGDHQVKRDASKEDVSSIRDEIVEVLRRGSSKGSGLDWSQLAKDVVERYGDRIANLNHILNRSSSSSTTSDLDASTTTNFTLIRTKLSVLTYTMLNPFLDTTHLTNTSSSSDPSSLWLPSTLERCSYRTRTVPRSKLTDQELLLKASIDFVTGRICSEVSEMFEESLLGSRKGREKELEVLVKEWRGRVKELMSWLDWPMWTRCEEACSWNEVCAIPMWPLTSRGGPRGDSDPKTEPIVPYCLALDGEGGRF